MKYLRKYNESITPDEADELLAELKDAGFVIYIDSDIEYNSVLEIDVNLFEIRIWLYDDNGDPTWFEYYEIKDKILQFASYVDCNGCSILNDSYINKRIPMDEDGLPIIDDFTKMHSFRITYLE